MAQCEQFVAELQSAGIRCRGDFRENYSPGWKFNHWELKGVLLHVEIGPCDVKSCHFVVVLRVGGKKTTIANSQAVERVKGMLEQFQEFLFDRAKVDYDSHVVVLESWEEFCANLDKIMVIMVPFCGEIPCEDLVKKTSTREDQSDPMPHPWGPRHSVFRSNSPRN